MANVAKIRIETDNGNVFEGTYKVEVITHDSKKSDLVIRHHLVGTFEDGKSADFSYTWNNDPSDDPDRRPHLLQGTARDREVLWYDPCDGIDNMDHSNWAEWCLIRELSDLCEAVESMYADG